MKGIIALMVFALAMLVAGCNDSASTETNAANTNDTASKILASAEAASDEAPAKVVQSDYEPQAGKELELADGEKVVIVSVADLDAHVKDMEGLVAIEGRISESYPDKSTIILVDIANTGCASECCPQAKIPVRLRAEGEEGNVPGVNKEVIVIADLSLTETGYNLAVREVRPARS